MDNSIFEKLRKIVFNVLGNIREEQIIAEAKFKDDFGADSLDTIEIMMAIEEEFNIEIPDEDLVELATVRQVVDYISRRLAEKAKQPSDVTANFQI